MGWALVGAGFLLGLSSGLHCVGMCGPLCGALAGRDASAIAWFHAGRALAYVSLGVLAALLAVFLSSLISFLGAVRHAMLLAPPASLVYGLSLLILGRSPVWATKLLRAFQGKTGVARLAHPGLRGMAWVLMPCGLSVAAVALALLGQSPASTGLVMLAFWAGTTSWLVFAAVGWRRLRRLRESTQHRWAGLALSLGGAVSLGHTMLTGTNTLFCLPG